ncbi:MAG: acylneuraminate cytidylyltransferase family protein [Candidatus Omnitrophica bacterium]|nr:acylneuraminate cytidylyltransferase family protein [Candidatus Omnitrophota bacterium]
MPPSSRVLAIIPARGGSKGMPRKNLRLLGGEPLIVHTIRHAQQATQIDHIAVSTDDEEIAAVSRTTGADVIRRPAELATDTASSEASLLHALDVLAREQWIRPELVVLLQCTSPLRAPDDIDRAIATLRRQRADSLFSACRSHAFVWRHTARGPICLTYDFRRRKPRQQLPPAWVENGSIYLTTSAALRKSRNRLSGTIAVHEMSPLDSFQVDTEEDFALIEQLWALRHRSHQETPRAARRAVAQARS